MMSPFTCLWCYFIVFGPHTVNAANLTYYYGSMNNYTSVPLTEPTKLLPCLDVNLITTFYIFGFNGTPTGLCSATMISTYLQLNDRNVILVDWQKEAYAGNQLEYALVVVKAMKVAEQLAKAIVTLIENGLNQAPVYCDGHSLGAQLCGITGKATQKYDITLPRVTGLDPAGPFFGALLGMSNGLDSSSAKYVQVLHTNPGSYGIAQSLGSADFWANCGSKKQPGCKTGEIGLLNDDDLCSHNRACILYSEALLSPRSFVAAFATSCSAWKAETSPKDVNYLGEDTDESKTGNYYFSTWATPPYSKGNDGLTAN